MRKLVHDIFSGKTEKLRKAQKRKQATIQSIVISKSTMSLLRAIAWLKKNGYKYDVDIKEHVYRFRQKEPKKNGVYFTKEIKPGIDFIFMR